MIRSTLFIPADGDSTAGYCYAERARSGGGLFVVLQDLPARAGGARDGFLRAAYRAIVARYQSAERPETPIALLRGVVLALDGAARQVETRVDDFRGLGVHVLVVDGARAYLLCGRDAPPRVRISGVMLPLAAGVAGAVEVGIETARSQHDLFAQSLTDSLALYRFDLGTVPEAGLEFFLGGLAEDAAAVMDALEVDRGPAARVTLERAAGAVLYVACRPVTQATVVAGGNVAAKRPAPWAAGRRVGLAVGVVVVAAVAFFALRGVWQHPSGDGSAQEARATRERAEPQDVRSEPEASVGSATELAAVTPEAAPDAPARGFAEVWQRAYREAVTSSPVAAEGTIVFGARDGHVYALEPSNGETVWTHNAGSGIGASPVVTGDAVVVCDYAGNVYRLGRADGKTAWKRALQEKIVSSPVVTGERVFVGTVKGNVYALSRDTGRVLWKFRTRGQIRGSLAATRGLVLVPSHDGRLYAIVENTGARAWAVPLGGPVSSSPATDGERVYVGTASGSVLALDVATGKQRWSFSTGAAVNAWLRVADGRVYAGSGDRSLYCIAAANGDLLWKYRTSGVILSRPGINGDRVVVTSYDGAVYCIDAATGQLEGRFDTAEAIFSSPLVLGDRVYFGNNAGRFYGLDLPH
jgi:outer membrane protein assembly factor BamB